MNIINNTNVTHIQRAPLKPDSELWLEYKTFWFVCLCSTFLTHFHQSYTVFHDPYYYTEVSKN